MSSYLSRNSPERTQKITIYGSYLSLTAKTIIKSMKLNLVTIKARWYRVIVVEEKKQKREWGEPIYKGIVISFRSKSGSYSIPTLYYEHHHTSTQPYNLVQFESWATIYPNSLSRLINKEQTSPNAPATSGMIKALAIAEVIASIAAVRKSLLSCSNSVLCDPATALRISD